MIFLSSLGQCHLLAFLASVFTSVNFCSECTPPRGKTHRENSVNRLRICGGRDGPKARGTTENPVEEVRADGVPWRSAWRHCGRRPRSCYKSRSGECRRCAD